MKTKTWIKLTFILTVPLGLALAEVAQADDLPPVAVKSGVT